MANGTERPGWSRRKREDDKYERRIVTGMITSDTFVMGMKDVLKDNLGLIQNMAARTIIKWCIDYFDVHQKAPGPTITQVFEDKFEGEEIDDTTADLTSIYLTGVSHEHERGDGVYDAYYETLQAKKSIQRLAIQSFRKDLKELDVEGRVEEAAPLISQYQQTILRISSQSQVDQLEQSILDTQDWLDKKIHRPRRFIDPWLHSGCLAMIYGPRGLGKSWLCYAIATALTRYRSSQKGEVGIGPHWEVRRPTGVIVVDGEMAEYDIQYRLKWLRDRYGKPHPDWPLHIISSTRNAREGKPIPNLALPSFRQSMLEMLEKRGDRIGLVILDNIASLCPGIVENSKEDWDPINQWLLDLRASGVAVILVHHAGKGGAQRGTSGREDALDIIIRLVLPHEYDPAQGAQLRISFDKARNVAPEAKLSPFTWVVRDIGTEKKGEEE